VGKKHLGWSKLYQILHPIGMNGKCDIKLDMPNQKQLTRTAESPKIGGVMVNSTKGQAHVGLRYIPKRLVQVSIMGLMLLCINPDVPSLSLMT